MRGYICVKVIDNKNVTRISWSRKKGLLSRYSKVIFSAIWSLVRFAIFHSKSADKRNSNYEEG